jgi:hypothetical protein
VWVASEFFEEVVAHRMCDSLKESPWDLNYCQEYAPHELREVVVTVA